MDLVADLEDAGRRAVDLTADSAILTALANDVGPEVVFQRQVIAHGAEGDVALAFSTSGGSANILAALAEARRRGLETVAIVGYDGGQILAEGLADHVVVAPSEYVPRIQEAHATAYHLLCELSGSPRPAALGTARA
jgi:D-sedoheptulose 7-phosphate isomerase